MSARDVVRVGVSSCLLGEEVRFDGGHKRDEFVNDTLARFVELVAVCPEVEVGMGTPREPVRLVELGGRTHLIGVKSGTEHTNAMERFAARRVAALEGEELSGFILKKDSPSCGMERVRLHRASGPPQRSGVGLFAAALLARLPLLPVEEEGRLRDPWLRESFIERVFAHHRMRGLFAGRWTPGDLVAFHSREKLNLMAHDRTSYDELGRLVARMKQLPRAEVATRYQELFMGALAKVARTRHHVNVLLHIAGYFKRLLDEASHRELHALIDDYRAGLVPLVVPITLLRHYVRLHGVEYLASQIYLQPHPKELMLRNHV